MKKIFILLLVITSSFIARASENIHVDQYGKGAPLVIIAGLGGTDAWQESIDKLAATNTCYLISVKGLDGTKSASSPDYLQIEKEIFDYLQKGKISKPTLIGHSFGGFMAMQIASHHPSYFKKLIIVDSYPFALGVYNPAFTKEFGIQQAAMLSKQLTSLPENAYQGFWAQNVQQFTTDTMFQNIILKKIVASERKFVTEVQSFALSNDIRSDVKNIKCPVVALCSSYLFKKAGLTDDMIQTRIKDQFSSIADCNIFISEARHFIMIDAKAWFLDNLMKNI